MSNRPPRTGVSPVDRDLEELFDRVRILEAVTPTPSPEDIITTGSYTPELTATVTDPILGGAGQAVGSWALAKQPGGSAGIGAVVGAIIFGAIGPDASIGDGTWRISLPFTGGSGFNDVDGSGLLGRATIKTSSNTPNQWFPMDAYSVDGPEFNRFEMYYPSAFPTGDLVKFGSTNPDWSFDLDNLAIIWNLTFITAGP